MDPKKIYTSNNSGIVTIPEASVELHAHPFLNKNSLLDVTTAIEQNELDVVALQGNLDESIYKKVCDETRKFYAGTVRDKAGIRYNGNRFLLNSREYTTREGFHLLTIGYSMDSAEPGMEIRKLIDAGLMNDALVVIAHPFVDNGRTRTAGHISAEKEKELADLCEEYPGQIALEWNGYCLPGLRDELKEILNMFGQKIEYHNVNHKVYDFAYDREIRQHNIPVVPGTDLHAINKKYLSAIGTSRLWVDVEGETASDIVYSMVENIFEKEYKFADGYVSTAHLIGAFGIPLLKQMLFGKKQENLQK